MKIQESGFTFIAPDGHYEYLRMSWLDFTVIRHFFFLLLLPDFVYYIFVFSIINDEFWLRGGSGKSTDTRRYDIAMQYYIFFFF